MPENEPYRIYWMNVGGGEAIEDTQLTKIFRGRGLPPGKLFFVDLAPGVEWPHPGLFIHVPTVSAPMKQPHNYAPGNLQAFSEVK